MHIHINTVYNISISVSESPRQLQNRTNRTSLFDNTINYSQTRNKSFTIIHNSCPPSLDPFSLFPPLVTRDVNWWHFRENPWWHDTRRSAPVIGKIFTAGKWPDFPIYISTLFRYLLSSDREKEECLNHTHRRCSYNFLWYMNISLHFVFQWQEGMLHRADERGWQVFQKRRDGG